MSEQPASSGVCSLKSIGPPVRCVASASAKPFESTSKHLLGGDDEPVFSACSGRPGDRVVVTAEAPRLVTRPGASVTVAVVCAGTVGGGQYSGAMRTAGDVPKKQLIVAAIAAGAVGIALITVAAWLVGWEHQDRWQRLVDGGWWAAVALRVISWLAIGKVGFKVALAVVLATVALFAWVRRRRGAPTASPAGSSGPGEGKA